MPPPRAGTAGPRASESSQATRIDAPPLTPSPAPEPAAARSSGTAEPPRRSGPLPGSSHQPPQPVPATSAESTSKPAPQPGPAVTVALSNGAGGVAVPGNQEKADGAPLLLDTSPGGCATGECLPEAPSPTPSRGRDDPSRPLLERWRAALDTVAGESPRHSASLKQARLLYLRVGEVGIAFRPDAGFHRTTVTGQSGRAAVERLLSSHFGRATRLVVDETPGAVTGGKTLAELDAEARAEHERTTGQSVRNHPAILATLRILGGELEHIQVLEHERTGAPGSDVIDEQP